MKGMCSRKRKYSNAQMITLTVKGSIVYWRYSDVGKTVLKIAGVFGPFQNDTSRRQLFTKSLRDLLHFSPTIQDVNKTRGIKYQEQKTKTRPKLKNNIFENTSHFKLIFTLA